MDLADRVAIDQLYALYGHVMDDREWDRLSDLFAAEFVFDATALGVPLMTTFEQVRATTESASQAPLGHHVTNVYVESVEGDSARVRAKAIGTYAGGKAFSGVYEDTLERSDGRWRIKHRVNRPSAAR
jgi:3-phenylpropionate/cinnamic acid dioxygenase small subunit